MKETKRKAREEPILKYSVYTTTVGRLFTLMFLQLKNGFLLEYHPSYKKYIYEEKIWDK